MSHPPNPRDATVDPSNPLRHEYETTGLLRACGTLADPGVIDSVIHDAPLFVEAVRKLKARGKHRVPYLFTPAIRKLACDENLTRTVRDIFGNDEWVAWGANIQAGTPNAAHRWHCDIESVYWPTITVGVGLRACRPDNVTQYIPGTHLLPINPDVSGDAGNTGLVLTAATQANPECNSIVRFTGFGVGSFTVFNARGWHCGDVEPSVDRLVLFLHYQRAGDRRVPYMRDHTKNMWYTKAAAFMPNPALGENYEHAVAASPVPQPSLVHRALRALRRRTGAVKARFFR